MKKLIIFIIGLLAIGITAVATAQPQGILTAKGEHQTLPAPDFAWKQAIAPAAYFAWQRPTWTADSSVVYNSPLRLRERMQVLGTAEEAFFTLTGTERGVLLQAAARFKVNAESMANELRYMPEWWRVEVVPEGVHIYVSPNKNRATALRLLTNLIGGAYGYLLSYEAIKANAATTAALRARILELENRKP